MMYYEMNTVVPILLESQSPETIKRIKEDASILQISSLSARSRVTTEILKRFRSMPAEFWERYLTLNENEQRLALLFMLLKTYKILYEFQINVLVRKHNSASPQFSSEDYFMEMYDIATRDELVDSWTDNTKKKVIQVYQVILKQAGIIGSNSELRRPDIENDAFTWYVQQNELWFLQACLLPSYEIERIKRMAI